MSPTVPFVKSHGLGNDFVIVEAAVLPQPASAYASFLADRRFGVGCDQVLVLEDVDGAAVRMRIFNPDGSEAEMCGNGIRAVADYLWRHRGVPRETTQIDTRAGVLTAEPLADGRVRVQMGRPELTVGALGADATRLETTPSAPATGLHCAAWPAELGPGRGVLLGNPHLVFFVEDATDAPLLAWGPRLERDAAFPNRINVELVSVRDPHTLHVRVWERGAGATLACGTGAAAAAVAAIDAGHVGSPVDVRLPGGVLTIAWTSGHPVEMTGPATEVFCATLNLAAEAAREEANRVRV